jgi:hypothetical protein
MQHSKVKKRDENRLSVFENRMLRIFGPDILVRGWRKLPEHTPVLQFTRISSTNHFLYGVLSRVYGIPGSLSLYKPTFTDTSNLFKYYNRGILKELIVSQLVKKYPPPLVLHHKAPYIVDLGLSIL